MKSKLMERNTALSKNIDSDCFRGGRKEIAMAIAKSTKVTATPRHVVITQGKDPVIVAINTPGSETVDVKEFEVPAVSADKIVDTNGAGDGKILRLKFSQHSLEDSSLNFLKIKTLRHALKL